MRAVQITDAAAREALFALVDEDISTVAEEEAMAAEVAEIDALIEQAEREWSAADRARARDARMRRRADRVVLRTLHEAVLLGGYEEAA